MAEMVLTAQVKAVHKDLLAFYEVAKHRFDKLDYSVQSLRDDLPEIVGGALREALRPR
jgi:hypothetical protein